MSIMDKMLDAFKLESTREMEEAEETSASECEGEQFSSAYNKYYENIAKQKENNLNITYENIECYDLRPFDLNKPFISDGHFMAIELRGENLKKAYGYLQEIHNILNPFKHLYTNAELPCEIGTDYWIWDPENHLPISHLRLTPYTATMKNNKYPFELWLSHCNNYGAEYIYMIYFNQNGEIGKCDLSLHGSSGAQLSYESKIRRNENGLYVMRINKTLYIEPYGSKTIYHYQDDKDFQNTQMLSLKGNRKNRQEELKEEDKKKQSGKKSMSHHSHMSQYDLERFAVMCNAQIEHEEEMKQYKKHD